MFKVPEPNRVAGEPGENQGYFEFEHPKITDYIFFCIASNGEGWEHVSITLRKYVRKGKVSGLQMVDRCPTWGEMCYIKGQFWDEEDPVMQFHPPKSQYVNQHSFCLHLWRPTNQEIKLPEISLVGVPNT